MILYDNKRHLVSDTSLQELHEFAARIGIKRAWFDSNPKHPHYDIPIKMILTVKRSSATYASSKDIVRRMIK